SAVGTPDRRVRPARTAADRPEVLGEQLPAGLVGEAFGGDRACRGVPPLSGRAGAAVPGRGRRGGERLDPQLDGDLAGPAHLGAHRAISVVRDSRITVTATWPGSVSSVS